MVVPATLCATLCDQAELRALDPLISEAESGMVRQAGQGVLRATAYQKAALAPALLETAGKSERFAYEKLGAAQRERLGLGLGLGLGLVLEP